MKNRVKLIVALLASVLVVCGMFTMTSFADDQTPASAKPHVWGFKKPTGDTATYPTKASICFFCTQNDCEYASNNKETLHFIRLVAKDDIYLENVEYDTEDLIGFKGDVEAFNKTGDLSLSDPEFYSGTTKLDNAPINKGTYIAKVEVLNKGEHTGWYMEDEFRILDIAMSVRDDIKFGDKIGPEDFTITIDGEKIDSSECDFFFESLENKNSNLSDANEFPKYVGHYNAMAIVPRTDSRNGGIVEAEFEIKQLSGDLTIMPITVDATQIKNLDFTDKNYSEAVAELVRKGVIKVNVPFLEEEKFPYGEPMFFVVMYDGKIYNPLTMGKVIITYSGTTASGKQVSGTFVPGVTYLQPGNYTLSGKITETKNNAFGRDTVDLTIEPAVPKLIKEPDAVYGLVANGKYQKLVEPGKLLNPKHGKILYSTDGGETYSSLIPTAKEAGDYTVTYKIKAIDSKFKDSEPVSFPVKIAASDADEVLPGDEVDPANAPVPRAKEVKATGKRKAIKVAWKAVDKENLDKVSKVEIQCSKDKDFNRGIKKKTVGKSKTSTTIKYLKKGTYYVRVRNVRYNNIINDEGQIDPEVKVKVVSGWTYRKVTVK